jgi:hypothetical protein
MILFAAVASFTWLFIIAAAVAHSRARQLTNASWEELVATIQPVASESITTVALDYLAPSKHQIEIEPHEIWELIGGLEGLQRMKKNATVLIALAVFAERWNFGEGVIVAERMRRDGLALRRAVRSIEWGLWIQYLFRTHSLRLPFHLHEAAASYYLMRQRLLALYEASHAGRYHRLAAAL